MVGACVDVLRMCVRVCMYDTYHSREPGTRWHSGLSLVAMAGARHGPRSLPVQPACSGSLPEARVVQAEHCQCQWQLESNNSSETFIQTVCGMLMATCTHMLRHNTTSMYAFTGGIRESDSCQWLSRPTCHWQCKVRAAMSHLKLNGN